MGTKSEQRRATEPFVFAVEPGTGKCDAPECDGQSDVCVVLQTETPGEPIMYGLCYAHRNKLVGMLTHPHGEE